MSVNRDSTLAAILAVLRSSDCYALKTLREYGRACRRFERFAGGEQQACDVTADALRQFHQWQVEQGYPSKDAAKQAQTVATVARHADPKVLPRWEARRRPEDGAANGAGDIKSWPLVRVVNDVLKQTGRRSRRTIVKYRQSCRRYCRFRGGPQSAADVTPALIDQFVDWQVAQDYAEGVAIDSADNVAAVVRVADRSRLPHKYRRGSDKAKRPFLDDADVDGSLESILVNEYFPSRSRIASKNTEQLYAAALARFSAFLGSPAMLDDLDDMTVSRWLRSMRDTHSAHTVVGYAKNVRAFWNWLAKRRRVELFPTFNDPPIPRKIPRAWSVSQLNALLAATATMPGHYCDVPAAAWWRAIVLVALDTGERAGALFQLRWEFYGAERGLLESPAEIRKGRGKSALYRLRRPAMEALEAIRLPQRELIFPRQGTADGFYKGFKALLESAGLPYEKHKSGLQKLRRSFATLVEAGGGDATAALMHSARKVTEQSYLDTRLIDRPAPNLLLPEFG